MTKKCAKCALHMRYMHNTHVVFLVYCTCKSYTCNTCIEHINTQYFTHKILLFTHVLQM